VEYHSVTEGRLDSKDVESEFLAFIRAGLNQRERKLISLRTRQALQRKRQRGERIGGRPPDGWHMVNGKLVPHAQEQRAIARMKELQALGYSTREIVEALEREAFKTRRGTRFSQTQVCRILKAA